MLKFILYTFFVFPIAVYPQSYSGKIVRVVEGDILQFQTPDSTYTIHLYGIDAPEEGQYYRDQVIDHLEKYLWADASFQIKKNFNFEGISAILTINGVNINKDLVKNGYAFYDRPHCIDAELARAEEHAREKKLGLWRSRSNVTPWEFKEGVLPKPSPTDGKIKVLICVDSDNNHFHKKYCKELLSCHGNVIVILRKQAKDLHMKPCKYCY
jgi:micrococcal nuclease